MLIGKGITTNRSSCGPFLSGAGQRGLPADPAARLPGAPGGGGEQAMPVLGRGLLEQDHL